MGIKLPLRACSCTTLLTPRCQALRYIFRRPTKYADYWTMTMGKVKDALPALIPQEEDAAQAARYGLRLEANVNILHFLSLTMIGPALVLNRLYLGNFVIVPTSVIVRPQTMSRLSPDTYLVCSTLCSSSNTTLICSHGHLDHGRLWLFSPRSRLCTFKLTGTAPKW